MRECAKVVWDMIKAGLAIALALVSIIVALPGQLLMWFAQALLFVAEKIMNAVRHKPEVEVIETN